MQFSYFIVAKLFGNAPKHMKLAKFALKAVKTEMEVDQRVLFYRKVTKKKKAKWTKGTSVDWFE